jgi:hypothetical protein
MQVFSVTKRLPTTKGLVKLPLFLILLRMTPSRQSFNHKLKQVLQISMIPDFDSLKLRDSCVVKLAFLFCSRKPN